MKQATKAMDKATLVGYYREMARIRAFEERAAEQYMHGKIRGFLHLYIGEEAIAVGAISTLEPQDYVVSHYRDHGHALARGMEPKTIMAELFGKATGSSGGKGGSMHLFDASRNFAGGYAIVGGQLPLALGISLAISYKHEDRIVLCFLGDGALNEGEFHESMNLASLWRLPVVYFCENNLYGMGSPVQETVAAPEIFRIAEAYNMPSQRIDGMSVLEVQEAMQDIVKRVRGGEGPFFVEALTYRFRGHSMADPVEYRQKTEEEKWRQRDPVPTYREWLLSSELASEGALSTIDEAIEREVEEAIQFAEQSPVPPPEALYQNIYGDPQGDGHA